MMRIGLVGKPNVGKSTAFSAMTQTPVEIANYPFTTIEPNIGIAWLPINEKCACYELLNKKNQDQNYDLILLNSGGLPPSEISNESQKVLRENNLIISDFTEYTFSLV